MYPKGIFLAAAAILLTATSAPGQHYHGADGPIQLKVDSFKVAIRFDESISPAGKQSLIESIDRIDHELDDDHIIDGFNAYALASGNNYVAFLDSLDTLDGIYLVEPYYLAMCDSPMVVGESFCTAFDTTVSLQEIDSINAAFKVVIDHQLYGMLNVYLLRNTDSSGFRVLELANAYHELTQTSVVRHKCLDIY